MAAIYGKEVYWKLSVLKMRSVIFESNLAAQIRTKIYSAWQAPVNFFGWIYLERVRPRNFFLRP